MEHASEYVLFKQNVGSGLCIDETSLSCGELYTVVTNREGHGGKGTLVAMVRGTKSEDIIKVLEMIHISKRKTVKEVTKWTESQKIRAQIIFEFYPELKSVYDQALELTNIYNKHYHKDVARAKLALWYNKIEKLGYGCFRTITNTMQNYYDTILNYFINRETNAFAESFNAKIKAFRAQFRGVRDIPFFIFRLCKLCV